MRSSPLKQQALWCGSIGSVLGMLIALNIIPIQSMGYVASTRIVATSSRMDRLLANTPDQLAILSETQAGCISIEPVALDSKMSDHVSTPHPEELVASKLKFFSWKPPSWQSLNAYLQEASAPAENVQEDASIARQLRQLRWEEEATRHSLAEVNRELLGIRPESESDRSFARLQSEEQHSSLAATETDSVLGPPTPILEESADLLSDTVNKAAETSTPYSMASHRAAESACELEALRDQLTGRLEAYHDSIASFERSQTRAFDHAKGVLAITQDWTLKPVASKISLAKAMGLILIGLTCWLGVGFLYLWLARRGGSDPSSLAIWLERMGVPHLGEWSSLPWQSPAMLATNARPVESNLDSSRLKQWLEWLALSLALWILLRLMVDPNWRVLMLDQPLGGLSRLFVRI